MMLPQSTMNQNGGTPSESIPFCENRQQCNIQDQNTNTIPKIHSEEIKHGRLKFEIEEEIEERTSATGGHS